VGIDFANLLLSGPCNRACPDCIGRSIGDLPSNLGLFPLAGLGLFVRELAARGIREVSVTGTSTDPLLYRHTRELVGALRAGVPGVRLSLHTNGVLALPRMHDLNLYDRATISIPSFREETYARLAGARGVPDLAAIVERARIPLKLSTLLTEHNLAEVPEIVARARELGLRRIVLRRRRGERSPLDPFPGAVPVRSFAGNPVYELDGLEATIWDFDRTHLGCLGLFSDGEIREGYDLVLRPQARAA
jgi:MoaA/NifB/PqqE/SkfB family radical SAM enzyme